MTKKRMTMQRYEEIKRLLKLNRSIREIARALQCTRRTIREIRDGKREPPDPKRTSQGGPLWSETMDWNEVLQDVLAGDPIKFIWEERALEKVTYANFWKQFHRKFPYFKEASVCHRIFSPGERCEVDYAGKKENRKIEWVEMKSGVLHEVEVFVGTLGFSQLIYAHAKENAQSPNFLDCHVQMYTFFGGVPKVTVCDNLKQGVSKCHLYDPDQNPAYRDLAEHFGTAIVPARRYHAKDKALVELAVKLLMRYFRFRYRKHIFTSLAEINSALLHCCDRLNHKVHRRFQVSRFSRWQDIEKKTLGPLPEKPFEVFESKDAKVHPDSHISIKGHFYSVPHLHRGQTVNVKITPHTIEVFFQGERLCVHPKARTRAGTYVTQLQHLPDNARAYHEATPKNLLAQAKYLHSDLHAMIEGLFQENALGHLRRAQGFIREARKEIQNLGEKKAKGIIQKAIETMLHYGRIRVPYFRELLNQSQREGFQKQRAKTSIHRKPDNPLLRYTKDKTQISTSNPKK